LPLESELAAVDAGPDRELAVDLCPAVVGEANRRRADVGFG